jgi:tetratricopeptide (TPR) repeat protein
MNNKPFQRFTLGTKEDSHTNPLSGGSMLLRIEQLVADERYREALQRIEKLQLMPELGEHLRIGVLKSQCLTGLGEFSRAFQAAQGVVESGSEYRQYRRTIIDVLLEMAAAAWGLGDPAEVLSACELAERVRIDLQADEESSLESMRADILYHESLGWYLQDDVHRGIECARENLSIRERLNDRLNVVKGYIRLGYLHIEVDTDETLKHIERGLELNREVNNKESIIFALLNKGLIQTWEGNWDEAEQLLWQSMSLMKQYDIGCNFLAGLFCLAVLYMRSGDFRRAEEFYQECLSEAERVGAASYISMCSNNLGEINRARGDLDEALKGYERMIDINKRTGRIASYVVGLSNCGMIQYARGNLDEALHLLEEARSVEEERYEAGLLTKSKGYSILYEVLVLVDKGIIKRAQQLVEELRQMAEESGNDRINQVYRSTAALLLRASALTRNRALAKDHLVEVVDGKLLDPEITTIAYLLLCDLLLEDLRLSGDTHVLDELKSCLTRLAETTVDQGSTILQAETMLLQSKVALLEFEVDKANRLLNQARSLADQKGLERLLKRIVDEHDVLLDELSIWEKLGEEKPGNVERTKQVRIHEQIGEMIQQGSWRKMLF